MFIVLLSSIVNPSDHTKCLSLSNQKCKIQSTLINLHPNECTQKFHYYPFVVNLDRCAGSCNTIIDLPLQHDYRNKWIKNLNKKYITQM